MSPDTTSFSLLLIDDDKAEKFIIERIVKSLTRESFCLDQVFKCSEAIALLEQRKYDLLLLDNRLSERMSAKFSVPIIKATNNTLPIAIISNDVSLDYLQSPDRLDVDYIVDKRNLIEFFREQIPKLLS